MKLHRKQTYQEPWAQKCPGDPKKTKTNKRPLVVLKQNKPRSATKMNKRPLAAIKHNKPLSATTGKRAKKLSKPKNKKLTHNASAQALSKKVNKVISSLKQG